MILTVPTPGACERVGLTTGVKDKQSKVSIVCGQTCFGRIPLMYKSCCFLSCPLCILGLVVIFLARR